ncbi:unnamed protein product, partial [Candidula unifasciata]
HSRHASSGSAHMRPTSLRELPEPPISIHHSRNKSLSGVEALSTSAKGSGGAGAPGAGMGDLSHHQHGHHARNCKSVPSVNIIASMEKDQPHSDGYDHLGPKRCIKPTDYDSLAEPESTDGETPVSETSGVLDGHYSQLRERTYAVVGDVKARAKELFDPYSHAKDKDDSSSDYYSQEDPYNDIDDSGGSVSSSFIHRLRQSRDADDLYTTVHDGSRATNMKRIQETRVVRASLPPNIGASSGRKLPPPAIPDDDGDAEEEYAVVKKTKGMSQQGAEKGVHMYSDSDISSYNSGPPEPPRLYNEYDSLEESSPTPPTYSREHKYSKVTARESLASMSARNALPVNPYEMVMDLAENAYATVDGGSGDGVVLRGGVACENAENRLSEASDTYAEIGNSGAGLSSSIISSSSSTGGNNSSSSVAPIPPSLDSLHLMTKSQTSSEGDRLSDRHLASPEDSAMSLNIWSNSHEDEDSEDGYSTLKKPGSPPQSSSLPTIPDSSLISDEESVEVTLVPNYQTVKDCISDSETMDETENDPNYESVEEMRAKVAQLKAKCTSLDTRTPPLIPDTGTNMHVPTPGGFTTNSSMSLPTDSLRNKDDLQKSGPRRQRLDHDYEEVDLSPPTSPVTPSSSMNHSASSSYHITSVSTSYAAASSQMVTETVLGVTEVRERVVQSHMYEELTEVRAKTLQMNKHRKSQSLVKNSSEEKVKTSKKKSEEKVKSGSEKKKVSEEKKKGWSLDKRKGGAGDKAKEDKRKDGSEDKRKSAAEDKKVSGDGKRKSGAEDKRFDLAAINGTRL